MWTHPRRDLWGLQDAQLQCCNTQSHINTHLSLSVLIISTPCHRFKPQWTSVTAVYLHQTQPGRPGSRKGRSSPQTRTWRCQMERRLNDKEEKNSNVQKNNRLQSRGASMHSGLTWTWISVVMNHSLWKSWRSTVTSPFGLGSLVVFTL